MRRMDYRRRVPTGGMRVFLPGRGDRKAEAGVK